jgi:hypothetical protein
VDPTLVQLARSANAGSTCPEIRVLAGNTLFVGTPAPSDEFLDATEYGIGEAYFKSKRPTKRKQDAVRAEAVDYAQHQMTTLRQLASTDSADPEVLTLKEAQIWPASGGDGVQVRAARVPLDAVDGWWIGGGQRLRAAGGGGWFFGALVPVEGP